MNSEAAWKSRSMSFLLTFSTRTFMVSPVSEFITSWFRPRQEASSFWKSGWCMTSFSCLEISASMAAMRAFTVRVMPLAVTMPGSSSCSTRFLISSWP